MVDVNVSVPSGVTPYLRSITAEKPSVTVYSNAGLTTPVTLPYALSASSPTTLYLGEVGQFRAVITDAAGAKVLAVGNGSANGATPLAFRPSTEGAPDPSGTYARRGTVTPWSGRLHAAAGDSITAGSGATNATTTAYVAMLGKIAGGLNVGRVVVNGGVAGERSDQVLTRVPALLAQCDVLEVLVGTNDAGVPASLATFAANITAIKAAADNVGKPVIFGTVPPRGSAAGTTIAATINRYNTWMRLWGAIYGVPIAEVYFALLDPATGYLSATYDSGDGIHPNDAGHLVIAQAFASVITALPTVTRRWPLGGRGGLFLDPLCQNAAQDWGNISGTVSGTRSLVAASGGDIQAGGWKRLTVDNSANGTQNTTTMGVTVTNANYSPGDVLLFGSWLRGSTLAMVGKVQLMDQSNAVLTIPWQAPPSITPGPVLFTYTVPASGTPTSIKFATVMTAAANAIGTVDVGMCDCLNLTAAGFPADVLAEL